MTRAQPTAAVAVGRITDSSPAWPNSRRKDGSTVSTSQPPARQAVFRETFGDDIDDVVAVVKTLPMAKWWDIDVFPLNPPAGS
ncbi:MAG: hypothetical protein WCP26_12375 [Actinomycetes bacterium]